MHIVGYVDFPMGMGEAKEARLELMDERRVIDDGVNEEYASVRTPHRNPKSPMCGADCALAHVLLLRALRFRLLSIRGVPHVEAHIGTRCCRTSER